MNLFDGLGCQTIVNIEFCRETTEIDSNGSVKKSIPRSRKDGETWGTLLKKVHGVTYPSRPRFASGYLRKSCRK